MQETRVRQGYLVIADISGYTAFLTGNELEHAQGIIAELTQAILQSFLGPWRLVKLEGDAVFVHTPASAFADAERVFEAVEACYCRFSDHKADIARATTCRCTACGNVESLDLKFVTHFGDYVEQELGGRHDLAGPDVILVHRLLKNSVIETTGLKAYAFYTERVRRRLSHTPALVSHSESYDSFGEVEGGVADLLPVLAAWREQRRVTITAEEADIAYTFRLPLPLEAAWDHWVNPALSPRWMSGTTSSSGEANKDGRSGVGGGYHCAHGAGVSRARYLDWRPFALVTTEKTPIKSTLTTPPHMLDSAEFTAIDAAQTEIVYRCKILDRSLKTRLRVLIMKRILPRSFAKDEARLRRLLESGDSLTTAMEAGAGDDVR